MVENRWQIVLGSVILLLLLLTGAFSLGVYVGEHGLTGRGLTYQPAPGAAPQGGPAQPQGQAPGQDAGRPAVIGRILNVSPEGLELATQDGRRRVELHDRTVYMELNGPALQLSDLENWDIVAIYGEMIAGDGGRLLAQVVVRLPPNPPSAP